MSLLSGLIDSLTGKDDSETVIHPCGNCESNCGVYPKACEECKPYKEQLVNALYNVANIDAFYAKYEVVSPESVPAGTTTCPYCGAPASGAVCEYCGSRIAESNGNIQVSSAGEIPNPIIEARDIIYNRRSVIDKYSDTSDSASTDLLGSIVSALTGGDKDAENSLGTAMTESEIKTMAEKYSVSVRDYLEGLDMGTYLTKTAYEKKQAAQTVSATGIAAGTAGVGAVAGSALGNYGYSHRPANMPQMPPQTGHQSSARPPMNNQARPPMNNQARPPQQGNHAAQQNNHSAQNGHRPGQQSTRPGQQGSHNAQHGSGAKKPGGSGNTRPARKTK